jgi:hypothetical protein
MNYDGLEFGMAIQLEVDEEVKDFILNYCKEQEYDLLVEGGIFHPLSIEENSLQTRSNGTHAIANFLLELDKEFFKLLALQLIKDLISKKKKND